jgi:hypothetical protein
MCQYNVPSVRIRDTSQRIWKIRVWLYPVKSTCQGEGEVRMGWLPKDFSG